MFLAGGAAALGAGGLGTLARLARAGDRPEADERFYVFAYFSGGWDVLLGLDPRDPAVFDGDSVAATRIQPAYELQRARDLALVRPSPDAAEEMVFGPYIGGLAAHWERLAVVRGMSMDTLTHEVGRRRFLTGRPPSGLLARGASGSAWLASQFPDGALMPNLSVGVESFNPDLPVEVSAVRVSNAADLVALLRRADPTLDPALDPLVALRLGDDAACARAYGSPTLRAAESSRLRLRAVLEADAQALFNFGASTPEMQALRARYGFTTDLGSPEAQAALAAQAISSGVSRVVTLQATGGLDTHFDDWQTEQGPRQQRGFDAIAKLATHLAELPYKDTGESFLDRTTIVGFSEFMRTPLLNARGGRDHWLTNSCFALGGKIRGNTVIGASSDVGMSPQAVDLATGRVDAGGEVIRPEHILRTLLVDAGLTDDGADLRVPPIPALLRG
jgi:uncharacterized protein (DUF1501 family)